MTSKKLLMIPGPIEFEQPVMQAIAAPTSSHVAPDFINSFANALTMMKRAWFCPQGQPFVVAGSGTLAMEMAVCNLLETGDNVLVVSTGYFGARYADILKRYRANVDVLAAPTGHIVPLDKIENSLKLKKYKLVTITHVDTSTAVLNDPVPIAKIAGRYGALSILDGVCSVAGEEIRQEEWGIDVVLTASQKAIGVPPGLALLVASPRAIEVWRKRKSPVANYYADWGNWLPIMENYAAANPSYFATPPVNLVRALESSLKLILSEGMEARFARHKKVAQAFRSALLALGLRMIPAEEKISANTLSAPYYPRSISGGKFLADVHKNGVVLAGGLLPNLKSQYFRIGHMGSVSRSECLATLGAIEAALKMGDYQFINGCGLKAAQDIMNISEMQK